MSTNPPLSDILSKLDAAVENCHDLHRADIKQLGEFCHSIVEEVDKFCAIVGNLELPYHPEIDKEKLGVPLGEGLRYIRDRSTTEVCAYVVRAARSASKQRDYFVSISDLKSNARTTVCDRVIKPALVACEVRGVSPPCHFRCKPYRYSLGAKPIFLCKLHRKMHQHRLRRSLCDCWAPGTSKMNPQLCTLDACYGGRGSTL